MYFYYLIFALFVLFSLITDTKTKKSFFVFSTFLLIVIAAFRGDNVDRDYLTYISYLKDLDNLSLIQLEPTFFIIAHISLLLGSSVILFIIYAIVGVSIKAKAITNLTQFWFLSLIIYFSYYFLLHEMTQVRVGVSAGILLLAVPDIYNRKLTPFLLKVLIGCLFHYSMIVFLPFYFLGGTKINKIFYLGGIIFVYVFYFLGLNVFSILSLIPLGFLQVKIDSYQILMDQDKNVEINVINILMILRVFYMIILIYKQELLQSINVYSTVLIKIYSWSLFCLVLLASMPVMAFRVNQLLCIVEIILWPFMIYLFREKYLMTSIVLLVALGMLSIELFYNGLISAYFNL
ncbi:EpsG-like putative glucosyltransferase [Flavobacterium araucananum]|uniref:EpsG family protein n=1 Tax=Flavobacterium araucananum TaxID=946678 RepID=A0A227PG16_9FLAO|nr:EpsG family protein [Flavobacterium araucananum]OXG08762.1 hypothetical protein B0A64_04875 [Flavobacterium araucananum]PWJ97748.1 EpsG-like putative glucosyltransferase [Flavobacterium araucananum]